jgi:predicted DNA-binding transcriptional regulator AlpA
MDTGRLIMPLQSTGLGREERRGVDAVSAGGDGLDRVRTLKETAKLLGVSMATLRRRIADGAIKTVRLSQRRIGVLDSARQAFLQENAT